VESLNLTDDQKAKVKDIFADAKTKRQAVSNYAGVGSTRRPKLSAVSEAIREYIDAVRGSKQGLTRLNWFGWF
jgi:Spy/CpxP family protein refolding chaperone